MASAVDSRLAYARLSTVATASRLPTATRGSNNSYTTSWDTTLVLGVQPGIPLRKIKKSHLTHEHPSRCQQIVNPILNRRCAKMAFLEVPFTKW